MNTFSALKIRSKDKLPFCPDEYSRFKYGSKTIAKKFGKILAKEFFQSPKFCEMVAMGAPIVVCSSPYFNIPTATFAMKDYFISELNTKLVDDYGLDPVQELQIYRQPSYTQDYGKMSLKDREKAISGDSFYIDAQFCYNKYILFLDDIKITGAHERRIIQMCKDREIKAAGMLSLYFAELINPEVDPELEHFLNFHFIKSIQNIDWIIKNDKFLFNTRVTKYILSAPEIEFKYFILYQSEVFRDTLYKYAIANKYHLADEFSKNLLTLKEMLY